MSYFLFIYVIAAIIGGLFFLWRKNWRKFMINTHKLLCDEVYVKDLSFDGDDDRNSFERWIKCTQYYSEINQKDFDVANEGYFSLESISWELPQKKFCINYTMLQVLSLPRIILMIGYIYPNIIFKYLECQKLVKDWEKRKILIKTQEFIQRNTFHFYVVIVSIGVYMLGFNLT